MIWLRGEVADQSQCRHYGILIPTGRRDMSETLTAPFAVWTWSVMKPFSLHLSFVRQTQQMRRTPMRSGPWVPARTLRPWTGPTGRTALFRSLLEEAVAVVRFVVNRCAFDRLLEHENDLSRAMARVSDAHKWPLRTSAAQEPHGYHSTFASQSSIATSCLEDTKHEKYTYPLGCGECRCRSLCACQYSVCKGAAEMAAMASAGK
nr:hypothetical protein CFP56_24284 [Quercus suber]